MARIVAPGLPHHVIQRGLSGRRVFFTDEDYSTFIDIMAASCSRHGVEIWTYCLMPDHTHLIAVPEDRVALSACIRETSRRYIRYISRRKGMRGKFWQGKYASHPMDERHLVSCTRYIEINPVKRDYVPRPEQWAWSSASAHISGRDDRLVTAKPLLKRVKRDWSDFLGQERPPEEADLFYRHERTGRPLGSGEFVGKIMQRLAK